MNPTIDLESIDLNEHKDFDKLLRRIRNAGKFSHDDIKALDLMSRFIADQVKKLTHFNALSKQSQARSYLPIPIELTSYLIATP